MWLSKGIQNIQVHFHEKDKSCYQLRGFALDPNNGPQTGFTFFVALALFIYCTVCVLFRVRPKPNEQGLYALSPPQPRLELGYTELSQSTDMGGEVTNTGYEAMPTSLGL